jgi:molecular chaperone HscB
MKRILESRKLFGITKDADLAELKIIYRNLMKEWHPDKFQEGDELKAQADIKSKEIISAYHFLVSISPETHAINKEEYLATISTSGIDDFIYKGQTLKVTFQNGSVYEYFGVPKNVYNKLINSSTQARFARRHIFESYTYRKSSKQMEE